MRISVAVCTWNRCSLLGRALEQMTKLDVPAGVEWELLVVNNNSTDATDQVIASYGDRLPLRRLYEPQQGLSHARNLAVREAHGDYIIWTDDDVLVERAWLAEYRAAFARWPEAAVFGGPVELWLAGAPPQWLERTLPRVKYAFAVQDFGPEPTPLKLGVVPTGANFAVRTDEQRRFLYDTELGLRPGGTIRGEEVAVIEALLQDGATGWWVPAARVRHYIPPERQTIDYLRQYYFGIGEYDGRQLAPNGEAMIFGKPRWLWREAIEAETRYRWRRLLAQPEVWMEDLITASRTWGRLHGYAWRPGSATVRHE